MAIAHSIFTLDGGFQLFLATFDVSVTVVQLKFVIWLDIKKNQNVHLRTTCLFWHTKVSKNQFSLTQWQLLMVQLWHWHQKLIKIIETAYLKWILSELQPFVCRILCFPKTFEKIEKKEVFRKSALAHWIFTLDGGFQWLYRLLMSVSQLYH